MSIEKQIMINGVDVNQCENFRPKDRFTCYPYICNCHQKPNCYFKQLARKTQEYERLKKDFFKQNEWLQQRAKECEDLKEEKEVIKKYLGISDKSIMQRLEELTEYKLKRQLKYIKIQEENDCYRKALEEIEELIRGDEFIRCPINDDVNCNYFTRNKILDIINKAKGEEND